VTAAAEQGDEADEGRLELERGMVGGSRHGVAATVRRHRRSRPSQLIPGVLRTRCGEGATMTSDQHGACIATLDSFPGQEAGDLEALDRVLAEAIPLPADADLDRALFGIFERFPNEDGYGVYWSIVHLLEKRGGYEEALLQSLRRRAVSFNTLMLGRMLNAGITHCGGISIEGLLGDLAVSDQVDPDARETAADFLDHHRKGTAESAK